MTFTDKRFTLIFDAVMVEEGEEEPAAEMHVVYRRAGYDTALRIEKAFCIDPLTTLNDQGVEATQVSVASKPQGGGR